MKKGDTVICINDKWHKIDMSKESLLFRITYFFHKKPIKNKKYIIDEIIYNRGHLYLSLVGFKLESYLMVNFIASDDGSFANLILEYITEEIKQTYIPKK